MSKNKKRNINFDTLSMKCNYQKRQSKYKNKTGLIAVTKQGENE